jgi:integrase
MGRDDRGNQKFVYRTVCARTKREADAALSAWLADLDSNAYVAPSHTTVGEWLDTWLTDYAAHSVAPYTLDGYRQIVKKRLVPALGAVRLDRLSPVQIQRYYVEELEHGRAKGEGGLSARTVSHHHRLLNTALRRAVRVGILASNPCDRVDPPRVKHVEMQAIDEVSTERMLAAAKDDGHLSLYPAVLLAANAGLRRGEVLGLRWSDLDTKTGVLTVSRTLQEPSGGIVFREPKSAMSRRALPLDAVTLKELARHRTRQKQQRLALGEAWQENGLICPGDLGEPWSPSRFSGALPGLLPPHRRPRAVPRPAALPCLAADQGRGAREGCPRTARSCLGWVHAQRVRTPAARHAGGRGLKAGRRSCRCTC